MEVTTEITGKSLKVKPSFLENKNYTLDIDGVSWYKKKTEVYKQPLDNYYCTKNVVLTENVLLQLL